MMDVGNTTAASSAQETARPSQKPDLDYDSFLRLLVATMKNQDPTKPNDPAQTLAQLASFSMVEQGIKTNAKLDALMSATSGGQAGSLIGKSVRSGDGLTQGKIVSVEIGNGALRAQIESGVWIDITAGVVVAAP